jgi:hypothetical protein
MRQPRGFVSRSASPAWLDRAHPATAPGVDREVLLGARLSLNWLNANDSNLLTRKSEAVTGSKITAFACGGKGLAA